MSTHHVPDIVGQPVDSTIDAANELQMFGFDGTFVNQKQDKTGRHEGHGYDDEYGDQDVWALHTAK